MRFNQRVINSVIGAMVIIGITSSFITILTQRESPIEIENAQEQAVIEEPIIEKEPPVEEEEGYSVGDVGISGLVMNQTLIDLYNKSLENPIQTKDEAVEITCKYYNEVTDKDGTMPSNEEIAYEMMRASSYFNENMNSCFSSVSSLMLEEFGARINGTRGVSGASQRMENIKLIYETALELEN